MISIACIHFAYISCCYVGQTSDKLCGRQEQPFVNRVCMKLNTLRKSPIRVTYFLVFQNTCLNFDDENNTGFYFNLHIFYDQNLFSTQQANWQPIFKHFARNTQITKRLILIYDIQHFAFLARETSQCRLNLHKNMIFWTFNLTSFWISGWYIFNKRNLRYTVRPRKKGNP